MAHSDVLTTTHRQCVSSKCLQAGDLAGTIHDTENGLPRSADRRLNPGILSERPGDRARTGDVELGKQSENSRVIAITRRIVTPDVQHTALRAKKSARSALRWPQWPSGPVAQRPHYHHPNSKTYAMPDYTASMNSSDVQPWLAFRHIDHAPSGTSPRGVLAAARHRTNRVHTGHRRSTPPGERDREGRMEHARHGLAIRAALGASAQFWLNAQIAWGLWQQLHSPGDIQTKKIKRVNAA